EQPSPRVIMFIVDDDRVPFEIMDNVFANLDPIDRADRYTLYNCLLVSESYFEFAAGRLWSRVILPIDPRRVEHRSRRRLLLGHVLNVEPPTSVGMDWRCRVYLRSIRALRCEYESSVEKYPEPWKPVATELLLPLLKSLDRLDASSAEGACLSALESARNITARPPRSVTLSTDLDDDAMIGMLCDARSLEFSATWSKEDGKFAKALRSLMSRRKKGALVEALSFPSCRRIDPPHRPIDGNAIAECLVEHGAGLRGLTIGVGSTFSSEMTGNVTSAVCNLTRLKMSFRNIRPGQADSSGELELALGLLIASRATLTEVELVAQRLDTLIVLPLSWLPALESLEITAHYFGHYKMIYPTDSLHALRRLTFTVKKCCFVMKNVAALMAAIHKLPALRDVSVNFREKVSEGYMKVAYVEVPLRLSGLRKLSLHWDLYRCGARVVITDWERVHAEGLPLLEDVEIKINNFDTKCFEDEDKGLPMLLRSAVSDERKTPALAYADVILSNSAGHDRSVHTFKWQVIG
ncbi:hypothetical protein HK101_005734, partial [Irineochytrium annulatum]